MKKIGMIGVGNMGSSILLSLINHKDYQFFIQSQRITKLDQFQNHPQVHVIAKEQIEVELIHQVDYLFLGVKPDQMDEVIKELSLDNLRKPLVWVSMAAGISLQWLGQRLPLQSPIIRIMPNTPMAVGQGYTAYAANKFVTANDKEEFEAMMEVTGLIDEINENLLDTVTGMAGSSPAFIYQLIEAMADAGVSEGLSRLQSYRMAAQAVKGAASMVLETGLHPAELKDQVTSPGGTTISGLLKLEESGFRHAIQTGVKEAIHRSRQMKQ